MRTRLHLFDSLILPILLYGCELWGYENIEQIEVLHRNVFRRMLELRKSAPKAMVYGEVGRHEIKFTVWKRMINFWKKVTKSTDKLSSVVFCWLHYRREATQWHVGIKKIPINCGIPLVEEYVGLVSEYEFEKFIKAKCQDLALQSWQIMLQNNSLCDNYRLYKHRLVFEPYLETLSRSDRVKLANFRCAATALPTVKSKFLNCPVESCPFCETRCKPDEDHLVLQCESFDDKRKDFSPKYY